MEMNPVQAIEQAIDDVNKLIRSAMDGELNLMMETLLDSRMRTGGVLTLLLSYVQAVWETEPNTLEIWKLATRDIAGRK